MIFRDEIFRRGIPNDQSWHGRVCCNLPVPVPLAPQRRTQRCQLQPPPRQQPLRLPIGTGGTWVGVFRGRGCHGSRVATECLYRPGEREFTAEDSGPENGEVDASASCDIDGQCCGAVKVSASVVLSYRVPLAKPRGAAAGKRKGQHCSPKLAGQPKGKKSVLN